MASWKAVLGWVSLAVLAFATSTVGEGRQAKAEGPSCSALAAELSNVPASPGLFTLRAKKPLYRFQERPYMRVAAGVKLALRAPEGVTEADLHRAAVCAASTGDASSPL